MDGAIPRSARFMLVKAALNYIGMTDRVIDSLVVHGMSRTEFARAVEFEVLARCSAAAPQEQAPKTDRDIYMICNSYESGFGHGTKKDGLDLSRTPHADPEHGEAYQIGYEAGERRSQEQAPADLTGAAWAVGRAEGRHDALEDAAKIVASLRDVDAGEKYRKFGRYNKLIEAVLILAESEIRALKSQPQQVTK